MTTVEIVASWPSAISNQFQEEIRYARICTFPMGNPKIVFLVVANG